MANAISEANISLAAVQEVSGNMAKATDSKTVKADLAISYMYEEETQEEDILIWGQAPCKVEVGRG